eukprot:TRINITY_DN37310_c0_g1_i1.p1 TRINITY_DN37310_c0_g1~~TRINITY_DN37310_c0_g1_i1.p1  ORF type:complete len:278 (+),score=40.53 TRINITY_DN37310_c0_g1_i1:114-947(+)
MSMDLAFPACLLDHARNPWLSRTLPVNGAGRSFRTGHYSSSRSEAALRAKGLSFNACWSQCSWLQKHSQRLRRRFGFLQRAAVQDSKAGSSTTQELELENWRLLSNGNFKGEVKGGILVEFKGQLVGPSDPGIVIAPDGQRYVLGQAARSTNYEQTASETKARDSDNSILQIAVASAAAAVAGVAAYLVLPGLLQSSQTLQIAPSNVPMTRTNVTIVETRKTLPDGSTAKITDRTTRKERTAPGKAPVVTERTTRTEKVVRDETKTALIVLQEAPRQ